MVVSSNYHLIPYPDHYFPVQPYARENSVVHPDAGQDSIERPDLFQRPHSDTKVNSNRFAVYGKSGDVTSSLQYCDADQVGRLIDLYA